MVHYAAIGDHQPLVVWDGVISMGALRRLFAGGALAIFVLTLSSVAASAAVKVAGPPAVFRLSPSRINQHLQPNLMILGQNFTPSTKVEVGGYPATTVDASDPNHLLVKLPSALPSGSYQVAVKNEAGVATAAERLTVDEPELGINRTTMLAAGGFLVLLLLVKRLSRTPSLA
jgi:hypothetical protein